MNFNELFASIKKKFAEHPEIMLERSKLSVQIADIFDNAFYILWDNSKCTLEPFHYNDCDISIIAAQRDIELLFTERQYLFLARNSLNINGSFNDVMDFHRMISYITGDSYNVQEEVISKMLFKQDMLKEDLNVIMNTLQLLVNDKIIKSLNTESIGTVANEKNSTPAKKEKIARTTTKRIPKNARDKK